MGELPNEFKRYRWENEEDRPYILEYLKWFFWDFEKELRSIYDKR